MTIQPISDHATLLHLTPEDLAPYHLSPDSLPLPQLRSLLQSLPIPLPTPLEIEAYPTPQGVLLFLHTPQSRPTPRRPLRRHRIRRKPT